MSAGRRETSGTGAGPATPWPVRRLRAEVTELLEGTVVAPVHRWVGCGLVEGTTVVSVRERWP